jgi:Glu-tRNA(Gln) amidotransferase subunit E-like FAD-binding protein
VEDLSVRDEDLREAEKYTEEATGYSIQLVRKPLTDFNREEVFGSDDEIEAAVVKAISDTGADSMKDMGKLMGILKGQLDGKADMGQVSQLIKSKLS